MHIGTLTMKIDTALLDKYHRGECSETELSALKHFFLANDPTELHNILKTEWEELNETNAIPKQPHQAEIWQNILHQQLKTPRIRSLSSLRRVQWGAIAASLLIGITLIGLFFLNRPSKSSPVVLHINTSNKVMKLELADGTRVWLNRNSKIKYPRHFSDSLRSVTLSGEAFFEVTKDPAKPFVVQTGTVQTQVLGTSFNVMAFPDLNRVEIALISGKVQVKMPSRRTRLGQSTTLSPGQILTYRKSDQAYNTDEFTADIPYAWRNGIIYFQKATIGEVVSRLQHQYGLTITVENEPMIQSLLVHRIDVDKMTLDQVLDGIDRVTDYQFEKITNTTFIVKPD